MQAPPAVLHCGAGGSGLAGIWYVPCALTTHQAVCTGYSREKGVTVPDTVDILLNQVSGMDHILGGGKCEGEKECQEVGAAGSVPWEREQFAVLDKPPES